MVFAEGIHVFSRNFTMIKFSALVWLLCVISACTLRAQDGPQEGGPELQICTGGRHGTNGSQSGDGVFNIGARYGWILTDAHGPSFVRGRFEYAVDVVPLFIVAQSANTAYGFSVNPFALKWNFALYGSVVPYIDIGGGALFTNVKVPEGTSHVNFTPTGAFGVHFLRGRY